MNRAFLVVGILVALVLAFFVAPLASSSPDGLERVAIDHKLDSNVKASPTEKSPLAGYSTGGDSRLSTGIAGVVGVGATLGIGYGLFFVMKKTRRSDDPTGSSA